MSDWSEIVKRGIIRKTVAIHPILDRYVRLTWSILIEAGYDASYSTALNYMLLLAVNLVKNVGVDEETREILRDFLEDKETLERLNLEEMLAKLSQHVELTVKPRSRGG